MHSNQHLQDFSNNQMFPFLMKVTSYKKSKSQKFSPNSTISQNNHQQTFDQCYQLNSQILENKAVTQKNRLVIHYQQKILKFQIMKFTRGHNYHRQTYALFGYYLDLFFKNGGDIPDINSDLLDFGVACFYVAVKNFQRSIPDLRHYQLNKIVKLQEKICYKLNFRLNPITYIQIADQILSCWDKFIQQSKQYSIYYLKSNNNQKQDYHRTAYLYEKLDCMSLILKTLDFDQFTLIMNLFFIQNRVNNQKSNPPLTLNQLTDKFYVKDNYFNIFNRFKNKYSNISHINLDIQVGKFVLGFFQLPFNTNNEIPKGTSFFDKIKKQTVNPKNKQVAIKNAAKYIDTQSK